MMRTLNLNGARVTPYVLAQIAEALESDGEVSVINAAKPSLGSGIASFELGKSMALSDIDARLSAIESHPALNIPSLESLRG